MLQKRVEWHSVRAINPTLHISLHPLLYLLIQFRKAGIQKAGNQKVVLRDKKYSPENFPVEPVENK
ncbi:hypothetical protein D3C80_1228270 [compost metagenome]